jgi:hypothetical protein
MLGVEALPWIATRKPVRVGMFRIVTVCKFHSCVEACLQPRTYMYTHAFFFFSPKVPSAASAHAQSTTVGKDKQGRHGVGKDKQGRLPMQAVREADLPRGKTCRAHDGLPRIAVRGDKGGCSVKCFPPRASESVKHTGICILVRAVQGHVAQAAVRCHHSTILPLTSAADSGGEKEGAP